MNKFIEVPANRSSIAHRKLVYSRGINDANYMTQPTVNGKKSICPYYSKWSRMLERCYSPALHAKNPTYLDCSVISEWLVFSSFKSWMRKQNWEGMDLDKDIKVKGNKVYSPDACLFIPHVLNSLLCNSSANRGLYPQGVYFDKSQQKFTAQLSYNNIRKTIGRYATSELASKAYQKARTEKIQWIIDDNTYPVATKYLNQHI